MCWCSTSPTHLTIAEQHGLPSFLRIHERLTESEAYALVLKHEVERDLDDDGAEYYLFYDSPDRSGQFDWYNQLRVEVPAKRKEILEEKKRQEAETKRKLAEAKLKMAEARQRDKEARELREYARLKSKFEPQRDK